eukprot:PITA_23378
MQLNTSKAIWDKINQSYKGDSQVKRAKLQTLRVQYETLKEHSDESIASYFLRVDEIVNPMKNMGEEIKEATIVEKILRSLSPKFESKVYAIEEKSKFLPTYQKEQTSSNSKIWKKKELQSERSGIALFTQGQENQWYIDNGCFKHMTGDKDKLLSYDSLEKEKNVSFGNDTPAFIKGKGYVYLKEKVKVENVVYVDCLKHNLLSVSKMCDQGNEVVF